MMTAAFASREARKHVEDEEAYVPARQFAEALREAHDVDGGARYFEGAQEPGGETRRWRSTLDFLLH